MDKVVVDSSVAIKWFVAQPNSDKANQILDAFDANELALLAPELIYTEVGNIAWKMYMFEGLASKEAQKIVDSFRLIKIELTSTVELLDDAFRLAVTHRRTVYDAMYLALSKREGCTFVTADKKLVNAVGAKFPNIVLLANWS